MYINELKRGAFSLLNKKGSLYTVEGDEFRQDEELSDVEYISEKEARVVKEEYIPNVLKELRKDKTIKFVRYSKVIREMKKKRV